MARPPRQSAASEDKALLFLHIPKAGGTTLHTIVGRRFTPDQTYNIDGMTPSQSIKKFIAMGETERAGIRLVKGHMPYGLHKYLSVPATYITMLRGPVDRIISHYYFVRRSPGVGHYEEVTSKKMSLADFVRERAAINAVNDQTRLISGVEKVNAKLLSDGACANEEPGSTDILAVAKKNLQDHFIAAGLSERFDESLLLFKRLLGWGNVYYVKQNVTKGRPDKQQVPGEAISLIEKHNELDMALYEYARQRFEEIIKEQGAAFRNDLGSFQRHNRLYGTVRRGYLLTRSAIPKVKAAISRPRK